MKPTSHTSGLSHLLYLHGFRSSPHSYKARLTQAWFAQHHPHVVLNCPQLPASPRAAALLIQDIMQAWPDPGRAVMGSSLGGYYASWAAARYNCPAVVLNPAVYPARDLQAHIGALTCWHDPQQRFDFKPEYLQELVALDSRNSPTQAPQMALIAKGDEVLDWREMVQRYQHAHIVLLEGGDHALTHDFAQQLPHLAQFLCTLGQPSQPGAHEQAL